MGSKQTMANPCPILKLPAEVKVHITAYLDTQHYGYFRRTCKDIDSAVLEPFTREFFTKRQFMLEEISIQALLDMSKHPVFSQRLSEVIISTQRLPTAPMSPVLPNSNASSRLALPAGHMDPDVFLCTGRAQDMLVEAFKNLPNLATVGVRDFSGLGRYRDGTEENRGDAKWKNYGWSYGREGGRYTSNANLQTPAIVFTMVLYALGKAQASSSAGENDSRVENVDVILRKFVRLSPKAFDILDGHVGSVTVPVLKRLKRLLLTLDAAEPGENALDRLASFLHATPQLETLRLNFQPSDANFPEKCLEWLGTTHQKSSATPLVTQTPQTSATSLNGALSNSKPLLPLSLPMLRNLDLGMLTVSPKPLISAAKNFNLSSLNLWKVVLLSPPGTDIREPAPFKDFLRGLADALPSSTALKEVSIGYASQAAWQQIVERIQFAKDGDPENHATDNQEHQVKYKSGFGSSAKQWLRDTAERTMVGNPSPRPMELGGSSEEEDSDEDQDDDEIHNLEVDEEDVEDDDDDDE